MSHYLEILYEITVTENYSKFSQTTWGEGQVWGMGLEKKMLKSDDQNATGDAQLICELFSEEHVTY